MSAEFFLTTERLGFRQWREDDLGLAMSLWGDPRVTRLIDARPRLGRDDVQRRLEAEIRTQSERGVQYWPFFLLETGDFAGCSGLKPYERDDRLYEMGFHVRFEHWGQGLATEAALAVVDHAIHTLQLPSLLAGHHPENHASRTVLEKLGFRHVRDEVFSGTGLVHPLYELRPATGAPPDPGVRKRGSGQEA
jgi:RimJ/RimL family protein N-acetyltransferase